VTIVPAAERTAFRLLPLATPPVREVPQSRPAEPFGREEAQGCLYVDIPYARRGSVWTAKWVQCSVSVYRARITFARKFTTTQMTLALSWLFCNVITHKQSMQRIAKSAHRRAKRSPLVVDISYISLPALFFLPPERSRIASFGVQ
jgi:hypothetical protein